MTDQSNRPQVDLYVKPILAAILDDVRRGLVPGDVVSFTQLHEFVDANDYLFANGVPNTADYPDTEGLVNEILDAVDAQLRARVLTGGIRVLRVGGGMDDVPMSEFVGLPVVVHPWSGAPARGTITSFDGTTPIVHLGAGITFRGEFPILLVVEG